MCPTAPLKKLKTVSDHIGTLDFARQMSHSQQSFKPSLSLLTVVFALLFLIVAQHLSIVNAGGPAEDSVMMLLCSGLVPVTPDCVNDSLQPFEGIVYDSDLDGVYTVADNVIVGNAPPLGIALSEEPRVRYRDNNGNSSWDNGEPIFYDQDGDFETLTDRVFLIGIPTELSTLVEDDSKIRFADSNANSVLNGVIVITARLEQLRGLNPDGTQEDVDAISVKYTYDSEILSPMRASYPSGQLLPHLSRFRPEVRIYCQTSGEQPSPLDSVTVDPSIGWVGASHLCNDPPRQPDVGLGCDPQITAFGCPGDGTGGPLQNIDVLSLQFMVTAFGSFTFDLLEDRPGSPGSNLVDIDATVSYSPLLFLQGAAFYNLPSSPVGGVIFHSYPMDSLFVGTSLGLAVLIVISIRIYSQRVKHGASARDSSQPLEDTVN